MKEIIRKIMINSLLLFLVSQVLEGLVIKGGFVSYIYGGILLAVLTVIVDPIIKIITLPFNLLTLGLLSFLSTLVALLLITIFYKNILVTSFTFEGFKFAGISIHGIFISVVLSYIVISGTIYVLNRFVDFIFIKK